MNSTLKTSQSAGASVLSPEVFYFLRFVIVCIISPLICGCGIVLNSLNIKIFVSMGFTDSVSVCFFAIAFWDFGCLLIRFTDAVIYYAHLLYPAWRVNIFDVSYLLVWHYSMLYDLSVVTTTYLAVQRGCCVTFPLRFRGVFTIRRALFTIGTLCFFVVVTYMPVFATMSLVTSTNQKTNLTYLHIHYTGNRKNILDGIDYFNNAVLVFGSQILIFISLIAISVGIRASAEFRKAAFRKETETDLQKKKRRYFTFKTNFRGVVSSLCRFQLKNTETMVPQHQQDQVIKVPKHQQNKLQPLQQDDSKKRDEISSKNSQHGSQEARTANMVISPKNSQKRRTAKMANSPKSCQHGNQETRTANMAISPNNCQKPRVNMAIGPKSCQRGNRERQQHSQDPQEANVKEPTMQHRRNKQQRINSKDMKAVLQTLLISLVFFTCTTPQAIAFIMRLTPYFSDSLNYQRFSNIFLLFYKIINVFEYINSSVNFFIYYKFNVKFKKGLANIGKCRKKDEAMAQEHSTKITA